MELHAHQPHVRYVRRTCWSRQRSHKQFIFFQKNETQDSIQYYEQDNLSWLLLQITCFLCHGRAITCLQMSCTSLLVLIIFPCLLSIYLFSLIWLYLTKHFGFIHLNTIKLFCRLCRFFSRYSSADGSSTWTGDGFRATDGDYGTAFFFGMGCAETKVTKFWQKQVFRVFRRFWWILADSGGS